ncbi:MAG: hypothetical protein K2G37_05130 [Clostridia bacterium]|nr:hypothetical protein [Clostridia bacterium]MDE7329260.1 hypothetical protein [Clostridia bacterium]
MFFGCEKETLSPIVSDIESNGYSADVYDEKELQIIENELTDIYTLAGKNCPLSFTAPENGIYTFETFGSVKNKFNASSGVVTDKEDGYNQKLVVELRKGETYVFNTQNLSLFRKIYQLKVEFTPTEIALDERKTLTVKAGESEFLTYYALDKIGFNYSLNKMGDFEVSVLSGNRSTVIDTVSMESKNSNAIILDSAGKYLIKITNNSANDTEIEFSLISAIQSEIGQSYNLEIGHKALYKLIPRENCSIGFEWKALGDVKVSLLDGKYDIIKENAGVTTYFELTLEKNKEYYLFFENDFYYDKQISFELFYTPSYVILGDNHIRKDYHSMLYAFSLSTDAQIKFKVDGDTSLSFYDSEWNAIEAKDGFYSIVGANKYFIVAQSSASVFDLTVTFENTEDFSGKIGEEGYRFIKFSPQKTDTYEVGGSNDYEWYESMLRPFGNMLHEGDTYYLKIYGDGGSDYDITITRKFTPIELGNRLNLKAGLYSIEIDEPGTYLVRTAISNGVTASYSITNSQNGVLCSGVKAGGKKSINFDVGIYFIEIDTNGDVEFSVNSLT